MFSHSAGFGPNGAIIHYSPANETNAKINTNSLLLLDSGGQYFGRTSIKFCLYHADGSLN